MKPTEPVGWDPGYVYEGYHAYIHQRHSPETS